MSSWRDGRLVTASCGTAHKFSSDYAFGYAETVGVILRSTGGRHAHIGARRAARSQIADALRGVNVPQDRFVHVAPDAVGDGDAVGA